MKRIIAILPFLLLSSCGSPSSKQQGINEKINYSLNCDNVTIVFDDNKTMRIANDKFHFIYSSFLYEIYMEINDGKLYTYDTTSQESQSTITESTYSTFCLNNIDFTFFPIKEFVVDASYSLVESKYISNYKENPTISPYWPKDVVDQIGVDVLKNVPFKITIELYNNNISKISADGILSITGNGTTCNYNTSSMNYYFSNYGTTIVDKPEWLNSNS